MACKPRYPLNPQATVEVGSQVFQRQFTLPCGIPAPEFRATAPAASSATRSASPSPRQCPTSVRWSESPINAPNWRRQTPYLCAVEYSSNVQINPVTRTEQDLQKYLFSTGTILAEITLGTIGAFIYSNLHLLCENPYSTIVVRLATARTRQTNPAGVFIPRWPGPSSDFGMTGWKCIKWLSGPYRITPSSQTSR